MIVSATGPMPADKFRELIDAPFGAAAKAIRQYDPLWGRSEGEKIRWSVRLSMDCPMVAAVTVEAETADEAENLAYEMSPHSIEWEPADGYSGDEFIVMNVEALP